MLRSVAKQSSMVRTPYISVVRRLVRAQQQAIPLRILRPCVRLLIYTMRAYM